MAIQPFQLHQLYGNKTVDDSFQRMVYDDHPHLKFNVELIAPIAMEQGLHFAIREGGRTVGSGVVSKINA